MAASTIATKQVPDITLKSNHLQHQLHKYTNNTEYLQMHKLNPIVLDMDLLCNILAAEPSGLITKYGSTTFVIDCRATSTTTYDETDFKPGILQLFEHGKKSPTLQGLYQSMVKGSSLYSRS